MHLAISNCCFSALITLQLLWTLRADSLNPVPDNPAGSRESPYWEFILREIVFKTISPPPPGNNLLYKQLLQAPFYGGPFPAFHVNEEQTTSLLSRGDVYHLANGGWILCQEGCSDCEICTQQKSSSIPTVTWMLKRIRRSVFFAGPRYDLQLTVLPRLDGSFHMRKLWPGPYVYVSSNNNALNSFTDYTLMQRNKENTVYPFGTTQSPPEIHDHIFTSGKVKGVLVDLRGKEQKDTKVDDGTLIESDDQTRSSTVGFETPSSTMSTFLSRKRGRDIPEKGRNRVGNDSDKIVERDVKNSTTMSTVEVPKVTLFYPQNVTMDKSVNSESEVAKDPRLILGTDQFGEKHIVHIVPAGDVYADSERNSLDPAVHPPHRKASHPLPLPTLRSLSTTEMHEDLSLYRKIFRRVIDSLNRHKNAIEKFLFSPKEAAHTGQSFIGPRGSFEDDNDPRNNDYNEEHVAQQRNATDVTSSDYPGKTSSHYHHTDLGRVPTTDYPQADITDHKDAVEASSTSRNTEKPQLEQPVLLSEKRYPQLARTNVQRPKQTITSLTPRLQDNNITHTTMDKVLLNQSRPSSRNGNTELPRAETYSTVSGATQVFRSVKEVDDKNVLTIEEVRSLFPTAKSPFHDQVMNQGNNSETLILKKVARTVVKNVDMLHDLASVRNASFRHEAVVTI